MVLARIHLARTALLEAKSIEEVWDIHEQANAALKILKSQRDGSFEVQNYAAEIKVRAERKLGEMTRDMPKQDGGDAMRARSHSVTEVVAPPSYADLGLDKMAVSRWQAIASVPEAQFEEFIANVKAAQEEITTVAIVREAQKIKRSDRKANPPPLPTGIFDVIYADPPWHYDNAIDYWSPAVKHYPTMDITAISSLAIPSAENAVLFLWTTNPFLQDALAVVDAWGFEYKTNIVWVKSNRIAKGQGSGFYVWGHHELLFICTKGSMVPEAKGRPQISSVLEADAGAHSQKPREIYGIIESLYPAGRYLELFARGEPRGSWTSWGTDLQPTVP